MNSTTFLGLEDRLYNRVLHGGVNFGILIDPLNFLPLVDLNRRYLTIFLDENGSFLLTKAHVYGANWTTQPPTSEAFSGLCHFETASGK